MFQAGHLEIGIRQEAKVSVLDLKGKIRLGDESSLLGRSLRSEIDAQRNILLNFASVTHLDSTGIGVLVEARVRAMGAGTGLRLCNLPPFVHRLVRQLALDQILAVYESEAAAMAGWV